MEPASPSANLMSVSGMRALRSRLGIKSVIQSPTLADSKGEIRAARALSHSHRRQRLESMLRESPPSPELSPVPQDGSESPSALLDVEGRVAHLRQRLRRRFRSPASASTLVAPRAFLPMLTVILFRCGVAITIVHWSQCAILSVSERLSEWL